MRIANVLDKKKLQDLTHCNNKKITLNFFNNFISSCFVLWLLIIEARDKNCAHES